MRIITLAIIHCSATPQGVRLSLTTALPRAHRRGFCDIGYHFYTRATERFTAAARWRKSAPIAKTTTGTP